MRCACSSIGIKGMSKSKAKQRARESEPDQGARTALSGYLYQILGILGLRAEADRVRHTGLELAAYIKLIREGTFDSERMGQDALITGGLATKLERVLLQFKHSIYSTSIGAKELLEIAEAFHRSGKSTQRTKPGPLGYLLVANRKLGPTARKLIADAIAGKPPNPPKKKLALAEPLRLILASMMTIAVDANTWTEAFESYAKDLGADAGEAARARDNFVGRLVKETADKPGFRIPSSLLREIICECSTARALTWNELGAVVQQDLAARAQRFDRQLIRRSVVEEISRLVDQHSVIVVHGAGGRGKSVSMYQAVVGQANRSPHPRPAKWLWVNELPEFGLSEIVADWRNLPEIRGRTDSHKTALDRLSNAYRLQPRPAFVLGVDGTDEVWDTNLDRLKSLIRFFWEA